MGIHIARALTSLRLTLNTKIHVHFLVIYAPLFQHFGTCTYMQLCKKKLFYNLLYKIYHIYIKNQTFKENTFKNLFFNFSSLRYLNRETPWKRFSEKRKVAKFFQLQIFVDKTTFNFHSFNKVNGFVTTQYTTIIFYPFYLNQ